VSFDEEIEVFEEWGLGREAREGRRGGVEKRRSLR